MVAPTRKNVNSVNHREILRCSHRIATGTAQINPNVCRGDHRSSVLIYGNSANRKECLRCFRHNRRGRRPRRLVYTHFFSAPASHRYGAIIDSANRGAWNEKTKIKILKTRGFVIYCRVFLCYHMFDKRTKGVHDYTKNIFCGERKYG